jgi:hypothetical protein
LVDFSLTVMAAPNISGAAAAAAGDGSGSSSGGFGFGNNFRVEGNKNGSSATASTNQVIALGPMLRRLMTLPNLETISLAVAEDNTSSDALQTAFFTSSSGSNPATAAAAAAVAATTTVPLGQLNPSSSSSSSPLLHLSPSWFTAVVDTEDEDPILAAEVLGQNLKDVVSKEKKKREMPESGHADNDGDGGYGAYSSFQHQGSAQDLHEGLSDGNFDGTTATAAAGTSSSGGCGVRSLVLGGVGLHPVVLTHGLLAPLASSLTHLSLHGLKGGHRLTPEGIIASR